MDFLLGVASSIVASIVAWWAVRIYKDWRLSEPIKAPIEEAQIAFGSTLKDVLSDPDLRSVTKGQALLSTLDSWYETMVGMTRGFDPEHARLSQLMREVFECKQNPPPAYLVEQIDEITIILAKTLPNRLAQLQFNINRMRQQSGFREKD